MGSDRPKGRDGLYRRATFYLRNYDRGIVHRLYVNLDNGEISIEDLTSLVQPSREEIEAAWAIIRRDPELGRYYSDPSVEFSGGYYDRSRVPDDPCSRDVCLQIGIVNRRPRHGFARQVVVNLSRENIANRAFRTPPSPVPPRRLSVPGKE